MFINGTGDRSVPYMGVTQAAPDGGEPSRISLGARDTVAYFIQRNHCSLAGHSTTIPQSGHSPETQVIRFAANDCPNGDDVLFYLINGGGHNWPGVTGILDEDSFGPTNLDINASDAIWDFFSTHALARDPPPVN
jgi:polyhydroxybutyrate depolymerase